MLLQATVSLIAVEYKNYSIDAEVRIEQRGENGPSWTVDVDHLAVYSEGPDGEFENVTKFLSKEQCKEIEDYLGKLANDYADDKDVAWIEVEKDHDGSKE